MTVIVEVPDTDHLRMARRLIGRRVRVSVVVNGSTQAERAYRAAGSQPVQRVLVQEERLGSAEQVLEMLNAGVRAVLPPDEERMTLDLRRYIDEIRAGYSPLLSAVAGDRENAEPFLSALTAVADVRPEPAEDSPLLEQEARILGKVAKGATSRQIAEEMDFQLQTVKNKIVMICTKTHARNRAHAVAIAISRGWINPV